MVRIILYRKNTTPPPARHDCNEVMSLVTTALNDSPLSRIFTICGVNLGCPVSARSTNSDECWRAAGNGTLETLSSNVNHLHIQDKTHVDQ
jgi:hypothetical protein